jgi:Rieske Fe-S protein
VIATGAVAAGGLALAGLDAAVGRGFAHDQSEAASANGVSAPASGAPITTASAVDAAGGGEFKKPAPGDPAYVVQTAPGKYAAFSAICTHAGCTVAFLKKTSQFQCPCHGGRYDAKTGKVLDGPPPAPLPQIAVANVDGQIHLA